MLKIGRQRGLSLLEVIIAVVIIAILATTGAPVFIEFYKEHRLKATAENLYYAIQYARSEAVKRNANVYLSFTTGDTWCYGINSGSACDCTTPSTCSLGTNSAGSPQQISLSDSGYGSNYVYFEGSHGAANSSGSLTLTLYGQSQLITISIGRMGNQQICSTGISGYTGC